MIIKNVDIVFQETPHEISLSLSIAGCQLKCKGCHSAELWYIKGGKELTLDLYESILMQYKGIASCVLFLGGEWDEVNLVKYLGIAKTNEFKTCLYTGETQVSQDIFDSLDYLKTGRWISELGGLDSTTTNQKYINCKTGENLNHLFRK